MYKTEGPYSEPGWGWKVNATNTLLHFVYIRAFVFRRVVRIKMELNFCII
jgi:hypothetical protein